MKIINKDVNLIADFEIKGITEESEDIIIEGYANTTSKDRGNDVILEEAWTKGGLDNYLKNPILLAFHKYDEPIGVMMEYNVNNKGLHITGKISKAAGKVYEMVKSEVLKAFSVGFRIKDADYNNDADIFVIKDLDLHEISVVSVGQNADSLFSVRKSFETENEYNEYKNSFIKVDKKSTTKGDTNVTKKVDADGNIVLTKEELAAQTDAAVQKALAKAKADEVAAKAEEDRIKAISIAAGETGAERLLAEVEKRFADKNTEMEKALEGLETVLKEKSDELLAMQKSKISFEDDTDSRKLTDTEIDTAVLLARIVNKKIEDTEYFKTHLIQKVGDHLAAATVYEQIYSTRMYDAIQDKLIMEPLFGGNKIAMSSRTMTFPFNPQAGHASWIDATDYKSFRNPSEEVVIAEDAGVGTADTTTGPNRNHLITTISLTAEKIASKEAIGYEEEEDSIIPILPIVRNAIATRMARTTDKVLLRADAGAALADVADIGTAPASFNGVATMADDDNCEIAQSGNFGGTNPITTADLQSARRLMGSYGLNPNDVVYILCESAYWDLLEDPDFRTMDLVGANATILRGQVGAVNGSPVIVSDSFATPAANGLAAIVLNTSNYLFGEMRGLTTERDKDVLNQKNWIVSTRRFGFNEIAAGTSTLNSCALLKYGA